TADGASGNNDASDPKIRKRDMDKARYIARRDAMSQEQKDEINRKHRESYARKNAHKKQKENINPNYHPIGGEPNASMDSGAITDRQELKRERDRARSANMSQEQRDVVNKKR
ncbi:unnamed protein product, partial [Urochloa humidicola]